jgi:hypothetical protein
MALAALQALAIRRKGDRLFAQRADQNIQQFLTDSHLITPTQ